MNENVHIFDNGVKIYDHHIIDLQKERYKECNIHEAEEEELFLDLLAQVEEGGTYVNIGAAVGYYSILTKLKRKDVVIHAYEPLKLHRQYFKNNIVLNKLHKNAIKIFSDAVSTNNALKKIVHNNYSSLISEEEKSYTTFEKITGVFTNHLVTTVPLGTVVKRANDEIALLQIDIQGHELPVFEANKDTLNQHSIKRIILGTHSPYIHVECSKILKQAGYTLTTDCYETKLQPDGILVGQL